MPMVIDEVLAPAGHDLRHGDEKKCKRAWGGTNEAYSRCSCLVSLVMGLAYVPALQKKPGVFLKKLPVFLKKLPAAKKLPVFFNKETPIFFLEKNS